MKRLHRKLTKLGSRRNSVSNNREKVLPPLDIRSIKKEHCRNWGKENAATAKIMTQGRRELGMGRSGEQRINTLMANPTGGHKGTPVWRSIS